MSQLPQCDDEERELPGAAPPDQDPSQQNGIHRGRATAETITMHVTCKIFSIYDPLTSGGAIKLDRFIEFSRRGIS